MGKIAVHLGTVLEDSQKYGQAFLVAFLLALPSLYLFSFLIVNRQAKDAPPKITDPIPFVFNTLQFVFNNRKFMKRATYVYTQPLSFLII